MVHIYGYHYIINSMISRGLWKWWSSHRVLPHCGRLCRLFGVGASLSMIDCALIWWLNPWKWIINLLNASSWFTWPYHYCIFILSKWLMLMPLSWEKLKSLCRRLYKWSISCRVLSHNFCFNLHAILHVFIW